MIEYTHEINRSLRERIGNSDWYYPRGAESLFMIAFTLLSSRVKDFRLESVAVKEGTLDDLQYVSDPNTYSFVWVFSEASSYTCLDKIVAKENANNRELIRLLDLENVIQSKTLTTHRILVCHETNTVFLVSDGYIYKEAKTNAMTLAFISNYFKIFSEKPLSDKEILFIFKATGLETTTNEVLPFVNELLENEMSRNFLIKIQFTNLIKTLNAGRLKQLKETENNLVYEMDNLLRQYSAKSTERKEILEKIAGIEFLHKDDDDGRDLINYLTSNTNICNVTIVGNEIMFIVKTFMYPYQADDWMSLRKSDSLFKGYNTFEFDDPENVKLLLDAILSPDHFLKIRMCAVYRFKLMCNLVEVIRNYDYVADGPEFKHYMPNPHYQYHGCMLENREVIASMLAKGDIISAFEAAVHAAKLVNIHEWSQTFSTFVKNLLATTASVIVSEEDGTAMNPAQALRYIKERNNKNNESEAN